MDNYSAPPIPQAFIWRRAHSFTGLWLVLFLIEHLLANSQAALFLGEDGSGFVRAVNGIKNLPYLPVIEIFLLGVPFLVHGWWGVRYLFTAKYNSSKTDGSAPSLPSYPRNRAYTWQRVTSWILLFGIVLHVVDMRFLNYPTTADLDGKTLYVNRVESDDGLHPLAAKFGFKIYSKPQALEEVKRAEKKGEELFFASALQNWPLNENQLLAVSPSFGVAELLLVRDTFKNPEMILLYTGLVLAACFHAFNGLWTFMISWGITLTARSQSLMRMAASALMAIVAFLGLAAIWGSYLFN